MTDADKIIFFRIMAAPSFARFGVFQPPAAHVFRETFALALSPGSIPGTDFSPLFISLIGSVWSSGFIGSAHDALQWRRWSGRRPRCKRGRRQMRFYRIIISDPKSGNVIAPPGFTSDLLGGATYTSFVNGQTLPGALDVSLDIPSIDAGTSQGFPLVQVRGVSIQEIAQANDLNPNLKTNTFKNISIYGGMQKGLPLANPDQAGLLFSGVILQSFGNREGKNQTLDFVLANGPAMPTQNNTGGGKTGGIGSISVPKNIVLNWKGGQQLGPALQSALQTAFQGYTINMAISQNIVRPVGDDISGWYPTLEQLSQSMRTMSRSLIKTTNYAGVSIVPNGSTIDVFDRYRSRRNRRPSRSRLRT